MPRSRPKQPPVYGPKAHFRGEDYPRCEAVPDESPGPGTWGCALPAGHPDFDNPRHRPHDWVKLAEA